MILTRTQWRTWLVCLVLALGTAALYCPARQFDFVQYDDPEYVFQNETVNRGLSGWGVMWALVDAHSANWHPVTWLSHMLDCQLFGLDPGAHHTVNVLLHAGNAALLFWLLHTLTGSVWRSALAAGLFAWHPLRVESVAWVAERKDLLSGFFFLLTLSAYVRYARLKNAKTARQQGECGKPSGEFAPWFPYVLALVCFALGLMSKPMLVTVPGILLLLDFWPLRRLEAWRLWTRASAELVLEKVPFLALACACGWLTLWAQKTGGAIVSWQAESLGTRIASALAGYSSYLGMTLWPHGLTVLYLRPASVAALSWVGGLLLVTGSLAGGWAGRSARPYLLVGTLWFLGMLLPVSGLVQVGLQSIADRYTYLPSIGLALMASWGLAELVSFLANHRVAKFLVPISAGVLLAACAGGTHEQLRYWRNTETLFGHALELDPANYVAHANLGVYYSRLGREAEAKFHRQRVKELDPTLREAARASGELAARPPMGK